MVKASNILKLYTRLNKVLPLISSSIIKTESPVKIERKMNNKNYLDNMLLYDIIKVLSNFTKLNIFELLNASEKYFDFFPNLIFLLEFDSNNPITSKFLYEFREEKFKVLTLEKKQNIMKTGYLELKNLFGTVFENVSG